MKKLRFKIFIIINCSKPGDDNDIVYQIIQKTDINWTFDCNNERVE